MNKVVKRFAENFEKAKNTHKTLPIEDITKSFK